MSLNENAIRYVPTSAKNGTQVSMALGYDIGDVEMIGADGIIECLYNPNKSFVSVVAHAPKDINASGLYSLYNAEEMISIRLAEQQKAANIGSYNSAYVLNHQNLSDEEAIIEDYISLFKAYRPQKIYTYSPFETDSEKIQCLKLVIIALSRMQDYTPKAVYGSSMSGSLQFIGNDKICEFGLANKLELIYSILDVYDSMIEDGKVLEPSYIAYDLSGVDDIEELSQSIGEQIDSYKDSILANLE